jgi:hypothetical protein
MSVILAISDMLEAMQSDVYLKATELGDKSGSYVTGMCYLSFLGLISIS